MRIGLLIIFVASVATAQYITTYDSRIAGPVASEYLSVDVANTDPITNPDYRDYNKIITLRSVGTPALIDIELGAGVTITGTVSQAQVALSNLVAVAQPARAKLKGKKRRNEVGAVSANIGKANGWAAGRDELVRLAELVQALQEDVELLKQKQESAP